MCSLSGFRPFIGSHFVHFDWWRRTFPFLLLLLSLVLAGCSTSPTGRSRLLMFSPEQMSQMGNQAFAELKTQIPQSQDEAVNSYVQCVAQNVLRYTPAAPGVRRWEVVVFEQDQVNAFALPGGKIGIFTGLLDVAETPDQLAAVIGHEIAHVQARHANERISRAQIVNLGMQIASIGLGGSSNAAVWQQALGLGFQVGVMLPYSRAEETEADAMGLIIMAKAGFDPRESVTLWQNMAENSDGAPPEMLSTHPGHDTRIETLQSGMRSAVSFYQQAVSQQRFPGCTVPGGGSRVDGEGDDIDGPGGA